MSVRETTSSGELEAFDERRHEVLGLMMAALTLLSILALASYPSHAGAGQNMVGHFGVTLASALITAFGVVAWWVPLELGFLTLRLFLSAQTRLGLATITTTLVFVFVGCALVHVSFAEYFIYEGHLAGGAIGELLGEVLRSLLGTIGTYIVGSAIMLVAILLRSPWSLSDVAFETREGMISLFERAKQNFYAVVDAWREAKEIELQDSATQGPRIISNRPQRRPPVEEMVDPEEDEEYDDEGEYEDDEYEYEDEGEYEDDEYEYEDEGEYEDEEEEAANKAKQKGAAPTIVAPTASRQRPRQGLIAPQAKQGSFKLPPASLLDEVDESEIRIDEHTLRTNAERLTEKLAAYGVHGRVDEIHPGPVVTMYEFEPQSGTKVSKIAGLADDLAMALAAQKVRIVAPIPGKARVGFELPNDDRQTVYLREIVEDRRWQLHKGSLPIALGKDIEGQPVYADLAKMPHLLVAGATGAGKSVGINVMLASLLSKKTPDDVRMLMIDPKVVELQVFDGIPHMLLPVVTDMKKAALALRWAVDEMERRYQLFADAGARNIDTYNKRVEKVLDGSMPIEKFFPKRRGKVKAQDENGNEVLLDAAEGEHPDALDITPEKLPSVVVVVDEFADLMMVAAKDVEACIARLAQKARAAGIHVILATQRPSVDVITGMIKANFPARVAFKVAQRQDSMTILGRQGAEHLLGSGDMLLLPPGSSDLERVHCAYVSEDEVKGICDFLRDQGEPVYQDEILKPRDDEQLFGQSDDPLYDRAVSVVAEAGYCSISHVQRKLGIGYNKAANLVEKMEQEGIIGPPSTKAGGRREVLIQAH